MSEEDLSSLWRRRWPGCPPLADTLKHAHGDRWVRFHSLPGSKRYPDDDTEYDIVLHRYNTVLDELFRGQEVRIVTSDWSTTPRPPGLSDRHASLNPDARYWTSVPTDETETDPEFITYTHLHVARRPWRPGLVDDLLRAAADDTAHDVMITSLSFDRVHHPYDGGADVLLPTTGERDTLRQNHADWLSHHPLGL
ncbi:hypothetical protein [Actinosynnema sp. NPDC020468]|uniref:DUF3885 domain-containing protein n=1 Tax=Actinosynnema sp. NPDC020468 TaxID=3154488 RepID=UPI0034040925